MKTWMTKACVGGLAAVATMAAAHEGEHDPNDLSFQAATPILDVASVEASIDHYTTKLGFTASWDWPEGDDKTFAAVSNGAVTLFLAETEGTIHPTWVFFDVNSADHVHEAYVEAGATIVEAPNDKPWGSREFLATDPDGNVLRVASPLPHDDEADEADEG